MLKFLEEIELGDCPVCHNGIGLLEEEKGQSYYVTCVDCGSHTADVPFRDDSERKAAAEGAAYLWNVGKVLSCYPGD